ncbi:MAG: acyl-[acyl-carrier-protein]--UDP-N-acetylglucosamine O-acyltransferase [Coxiella sp. RIFCSPHIGHO2_12_FULL_42_15]|nr:MAG: acyl-[acyl-carrier-protein]--UDP-N-acetylglucosamine O-acyltransferase [Coxiella sp. RIFCSPHIGHO2_12_FULL_42_15]
MISEHAMIHPTARIADDVSIGPWTVIGENVEIGAGSRVGSHVVIEKNTQLGVNNRIFSHVVLGTDPQHTGYRGEVTWLKIGDHNVIREFVTVNRGTNEVGVTHVGSHNYLMSYSHIAHDCTVGNHVVFANTASIAGHVSVGDYAILGAFSGVHQFVKIGAFSFLGRATKIFQDILPFMLVTGNPGAPRGLNSVGLRRHGFTPEDMASLKEAFSIIFRRGLKQVEIIAELEQLAKTNPHVMVLLQEIRSSKRGIARNAVEETLLIAT